MKSKLLIFFTFLALISKLSIAQTYITGTFNIRLDTEADKENQWKNRAAVVSQLIDFHDFDVLGTQEGFHHQLQDILKTLPQYAVYGKGRDDGKQAGEHSAILYKKDKFELLAQGDFWLSETPEKPTLGWDAKCCKRICSWVYLKDKKTKKHLHILR